LRVRGTASDCGNGEHRAREGHAPPLEYMMS
jgi:hypothetical protein